MRARMPWVLCVVVAFLLVAAGAGRLWAQNLEEVRQAIAARGATWTAGETSVMRLTPQERRRLSGGLAETGDGATPRQMAPLAAVELPRQFDWRNVNGKNFVSPVRDQQACGSCFVFAPVAALESQLIRASLANKNIDLSEQIPLSCAGAGDCANGGFASGTSDYLKTTGTALEQCDPYANADGVCGAACAGWKNRSYRIKGWSYANSGQLLTSPEVLKTAVLTKGPVVVRMVVFEDFYSYSGGVYTHVGGNETGGHFVLVVGWDDDQAAFIVKNSWGTGWGVQGYFLIMYSETSSPAVRFGEWAYAYDGAVRASGGFLAQLLAFLLGQ